jgi:hypothetical protein
MMRYQRGGLLMYAIGAVVVMALLAGAVIWVNHFIKVTWEDPAYARGAGEQLGKDSIVLEQVKTERENARTDTAKCVADAKVQSEATDRRKAAADRALIEARASKAEAQRRATEAQPQLTDLRAKAADKETKLLACQDELDVTAGALRDALRERRQGRVPAAPSKK